MWKRGLLLLVLNLLGMVVAEPEVPCFFIFGDSLSDNGNNNNLATLAKSNYRPYGIDFPDGPTGWFCNGRTAVDFIGELYIISLLLLLHLFFFRLSKYKDIISL